MANTNTPEQRQRGVIEHRTRAEQRRQAQQEALLSQDDISRDKFEGSRFVTQLVEFSFTRSGDVLVKLRVPYLYRHQAANLKDAYGIMLECDLKVWSQAEEARREAGL